MERASTGLRLHIWKSSTRKKKPNPSRVQSLCPVAATLRLRPTRQNGQRQSYRRFLTSGCRSLIRKDNGFSFSWDAEMQHPRNRRGQAYNLQNIPLGITTQRSLCQNQKLWKQCSKRYLFVVFIFLPSLLFSLAANLAISHYDSDHRPRIIGNGKILHSQSYRVSSGTRTLVPFGIKHLNMYFFC